MAGPMCDCYVLAQSRSARTAMAFLDRFLPHREPTWDKNDPAAVLGLSVEATIVDMLDFLASHPAISHTLYWSNLRSDSPTHAILAFNVDGTLVLGLSCEEDAQLAERVVGELRAFAGSEYGFWSLEEPPPGSREEFLRRVGSNRTE